MEGFILGLIVVSSPWWGYYLYQWLQRMELEQKQRKHLADLHARATRPFLSSEEFCRNIGVVLVELGTPTQYLEPMLATAKSIYEHDVPKFLPIPLDTNAYVLEKVAEARDKFDEKHIATALVKAFEVFLKGVPHSGHAQFQVAIKELVPLNKVVTEMNSHFWHAYKTYGLCRLITEQAVSGGLKVSKTKNPKWDFQYQGEDAHEVYLPKPLAALFEIEVPWGYSDSSRYQHHHVLGPTGTGKTTYLNHLILQDLTRVMEGQCSLIIMDSKKLAREISRLKCFAPGQPLYNRLIIVDANPKYPIALNPFHLEKDPKRRIDAAVDVLGYAIGGVAEATAMQEGALDWMIRIAAHDDQPNLYTLRTMFMPHKSGSTPLPHVHTRLDEDALFWLRTAYPQLLGPTKSGLVQRYMHVIGHQTMRRMFNATDCKLDLFDELHQGGKVVLVDADQNELDEPRREMFGRMFIALIQRLSIKRQHFDEETLKPIHCYIDEAADYIKDDPRFPAILAKARSARVSMCVAHQQWKGQIENVATQQALLDAHIRAECIDIVDNRGHVEVEMGHTRRARHYTLHPRKLEWRDRPQMSAAEYTRVREEIFDGYGAKDAPPPIPDIPVDDEATTKFHEVK